MNRSSTGILIPWEIQLKRLRSIIFDSKVGYYMSEAYNIGIDFGTSNCAVSVFVNGKVRTLPIDSGKKVLSSCVYVGDKAITVGREAERKRRLEPQRVIYGMKRMLGCLYSEKSFQELLPSFPFGVERNETDGIVLSVQGEHKKFEFSPIQMTAYVISQAVKSASEYLNGPINEAVITVPAYFNNIQRNDMINAGIVAGLEKVHLFSEPTAAAISYGLINASEQEMVLVFDFGAGSFDVSIINITGKTYAVLGCSGDSHCGGDDITNTILKEVISAFEGIFHKDPRSSPADMMLLWNAVEEAKKALSSVDSYDIDEQVMGVEFHYTLTRLDLENMNRRMFDRCLSMIDDTLKKAYVEEKNITHVLLVGGSCNIPYIRDNIMNRFGKKRVSSSINSMEAVSQGAAVIAGVSRDVVEKGFDFQLEMYTTTHNMGNDKTKMSELTVLDITPMNIGVRVSSGKLSTIIPANSSVPCRMRKEYQAHRANQERMKFRIFQGLEEMADDCKLISEIVVPIESPGPINDTRVEVTFSLDSNSSFYVQAVELKTMKSVSQVMDMGSQVLPRETVYEMQEQLRASMAQSSKVEKAELERNKFQKFIIQAQNHLDSLPSGPDVEEKKQTLQQYCDWIATHESASSAEYIQQRQLLNSLIYDN